MIRVMYRDRTYDVVKASVLDHLLTSGEILQFYRAGGWVTIGKDPTRGLGGSYYGQERRGQVRHLAGGEDITPIL